MYNEEDRLIAELEAFAVPFIRNLKLTQRNSIYVIADRLHRFSTRGLIKSFRIVDHPSKCCKWHAGALFGSKKDYLLFVDENAKPHVRGFIFWNALSILLLDVKIGTPFYFDPRGGYRLPQPEIQRVEIFHRCLTNTP